MYNFFHLKFAVLKMLFVEKYLHSIMHIQMSVIKIKEKKKEKNLTLKVSYLFNIQPNINFLSCMVFHYFSSYPMLKRKL